MRRIVGAATGPWQRQLARLSSEAPQQVEQVHGRPTWAKIRSHPLLWYRRFGSYTFGACFLCNAATAPFVEQTRDLFAEHPQLMSAALLCKSLYFAVVWPSFLPCALLAPAKTLQLGGGVRELINN